MEASHSVIHSVNFTLSCTSFDSSEICCIDVLLVLYGYYRYAKLQFYCFSQNMKNNATIHEKFLLLSIFFYVKIKKNSFQYKFRCFYINSVHSSNNSKRTKFFPNLGIPNLKKLGKKFFRPDFVATKFVLAHG